MRVAFFRVLAEVLAILLLSGTALSLGAGLRGGGAWGGLAMGVLLGVYAATGWTPRSYRKRISGK
jgi:hypothetical protein